MVFMERTTLRLTPGTHDRLRRAAADRGVSMAGLIREAIDEKLATGLDLDMWR